MDDQGADIFMGRARKMGKRTAKGRLSRAKVATFDKGTERAQERKAQFHGLGYDAVGRAFEAGLLGWEAGRPSARAKMLMDMAHSLSRAYWCEYEVGATGCTLGRGGRSGSHMGPPIRGLDDSRQEEWLLRMLAMVPPQEKALFDQMVIDPYPDSGPAWLDRLIAARRVGVEARDMDKARLDLVVRRLDLLVG